MFCTVLHKLKSPHNVGTIVRSHVAFGGGPVVFVGHELPWRFRKGTQAFSRKLEKKTEVVYLPDDDAFFGWCSDSVYTPVSIEISSDSVMLPEFHFPDNPAIVVGNEATGLPPSFVARCRDVAAIPQFGSTECLNVGVAASIALYELSRAKSGANEIGGSKFKVVTAG